MTNFVNEVFVHASDIQLLDDEPVNHILEWKPTALLVSGAAMYRNPSATDMAAVRKRALRLSEAIPICIIDHHILRCIEGIEWLDDMRAETKGRIQCAADFMDSNRRLFEARRKERNENLPVPVNWHNRC